MATEKRLIDANALMEAHVWKCGGDPYDQYYMGYQDALDNVEVIIENLPTVDAVEVVRCKDCVHYRVFDIRPNDRRCAVFDGANELPYPTEPDDFCSYGERRTDAD